MQLYASSFVKARKQNIFHVWYHEYFYSELCVLSILPDIDNSKILTGDLTLYATSMGKINRLEILYIYGLGKIIIYQLEKYMLEKKRNTQIVKEETNFNINYIVTLQYDIKFNIAILTGIGASKGTKLKLIYLGFQGGSNSTVLISLLVDHLERLNENGLISALTSWEIFNIISSNYILPFLNISTIGKTKQLLNVLTKLHSGAYGYSMNIKMNGRLFHSLYDNFVLTNIKIQTKFCISKCIVKRELMQHIYDFKDCQTLVDSDIFDTKGLFAKMYDNHCTDQSTLDWSMDVFASNFIQSRSLKIQLPGIFEKAEIWLNYHNYSIDGKEDQLIIRLEDERILKIINTSLILNGKSYHIFPETINQKVVYSWKEAEELCIQRGSHLPILNSKSDVQDLVNIILRAAWTGPIRMVFIGLRVSKTRVSYQ